MQSYSKEQFLEAVQTSKSKHQTMVKLGLVGEGGNYNVFNRLVKLYNADTSHFTGQGWSKGKMIGPKKPIEYYLFNKTTITSDKLKKRLIKEKYFEHKCYKCNNTTWWDKPIPIELHHIDGNSQNNNLSNLTILCPNCHALTENYCTKNYKRTKIIKPKKQTDPNWNKKPRPDKRKVQRPPYEQLKLEIEQSNYCVVGRKYGVTDNAIRKWVRVYEKYGE